MSMQLLNVMTAVATATPAPSHFSGDPKTLSSGSASAPPARSGPATQDVVVLPDDSDARCCVFPLTCDRPLTTLKGRFAYSLAVVHFRKLR